MNPLIQANGNCHMLENAANKSSALATPPSIEIPFLPQDIPHTGLAWDKGTGSADRQE